MEACPIQAWWGSGPSRSLLPPVVPELSFPRGPCPFILRLASAREALQGAAGFPDPRNLLVAWDPLESTYATHMEKESLLHQKQN